MRLRSASYHAAVSACAFAVLSRRIGRLRVRDARATVLGSRARCANCFRFGLASRGIAMKPAPFNYQAPGTLREAIDLLASNPEAVVIAGGQSLMPLLAFRLATPSLLVDLRRLTGLGDIAVDDAASGSARSYAGATSRAISGWRRRIRYCTRPSRMSRIIRSATAALSGAVLRM